jgi:alcohol dehydrogenase
MLRKTVLAKKLDPLVLITHRFKLADILDAYAVFGDAAASKALKVLIEA